MRGLEDFFNWQSDQDWTWGPFVSLRPAPDAEMRPWVWVRLCLIFTLIGIAVIGALGLICTAAPLLAIQLHHPLPLPIMEVIGTLTAMVSDRTVLGELTALVLSLPLLFVLFCLPYHWAWNRRAERLRREAESAPYLPEAESGIWPPAPTREV